MKPSILLAGAALLVVGSGLSAGAAGGAKPAKGTNELHCAVMTTNKVNVKDATAKKMYADHKGSRYYFCCAGCPEAFQKNPAKYAKNDHIALPKKGSK
jgi:YHS domain-containing protein